MKTVLARYVALILSSGAVFLSDTHAASEHAGHEGHNMAPSTPAPAAAPNAHGEHNHDAMPMDAHAGHAPKADATGAWAYLGRDNPTPHTGAGWEMWPVPGYGHMFISAQGQDPSLRCRALAAPSVMVDRATRAACELGVQPASD